MNRPSGNPRQNTVIPSTIEFRQSIPDALPGVKIDDTQVQQILVNLCTNAAHAMDEIGTLEVALDAVHLSREEAAFEPDLDPGDFVRLRVRDTG